MSSVLSGITCPRCGFAGWKRLGLDRKEKSYRLICSHPCCRYEFSIKIPLPEPVKAESVKAEAVKPEPEKKGSDHVS